MPELPFNIAREHYLAHVRLKGLSKRTQLHAERILGNFEEWLRWHRRELLDDIGKTGLNDLRSYFAERATLKSRQTGKLLSPVTIAQEVSFVAEFFRYLRYEGLTSEDPATRLERPKIPRGLPRAVSDEIAGPLLAAPDIDTPLGRRDRAILELFVATGARVSELQGLNEGDLDTVSAQLRIRAEIAKGRKERIIFVGAWFLAAWKQYQPDREKYYPRAHPDNPLFVSQLGRRISVSMIEKLVKAYAAEATGVRVTPHILRHTIATNLLENGADLMQVKEILGHANVSSTQIYTAVRRSKIMGASEAQGKARAKVAEFVEIVDPTKGRVEEKRASYKKMSRDLSRRIHKENDSDKKS